MVIFNTLLKMTPILPAISRTAFVPLLKNPFPKLSRAASGAPAVASRVRLPTEIYSVKEYSVKYRDHPDLIILHGLFGSKQNFRSFGKLLHAPRVVNFDLRNHGDCEHTDTMTYDEMASDVASAMSDMGIDCAAIIGHSMGIGR
eukprot:Selendium_serpulae@DN4950_c0_g1_i5.p2